MLKIQETPSLSNWAIRLRLSVEQEIRAEEPEMDFSPQLTTPLQFAAGYDPDDQKQMVRLWTRMEYGGYSGWYAEGDPTEITEFGPISSYFAEKLDGEVLTDPCPYTHAHTRAFCGREGCRES